MVDELINNVNSDNIPPGFPSDRELVERAQAGDCCGALDVLYEKYKQSMLHFAARMVGWANAPKAMQDAFHGLRYQILKADSTKPFYELLFTTVRNSCVNLLYRRYSKPLHWFAKRIVFNLTDAKDIVQEAFLKLTQKSATIDSSKGVSSWIYAVAENLSLDERRDKRKEQPASFDSMSNVPDSTQDPGKLAMSRGIYDCFAILTEKEQVVFSKRVFGGYKLRELADDCGVTIAAIQRRWIRALSKLKACLTKKGVQLE